MSSTPQTVSINTFVSERLALSMQKRSAKLSNLVTNPPSGTPTAKDGTAKRCATFGCDKFLEPVNGGWYIAGKEKMYHSQACRMVQANRERAEYVAGLETEVVYLQKLNQDLNNRIETLTKSKK